MDRRISIGKLDIKRGEPWFEDGNIVLITQDHPTAFRVHRGVLARHSEIFSHMFELPQSTALDAEYFEGCQIVTMFDMPIELSNLVKTIYDGPNFSNDGPEGFFHLAGILRLATKYFIGQIRRQAIEYLSQTWPTTLKGHDEMVHAALNSPSVNNLTYPYVHPLHVLNLAREVNANVVIPSALYFLSLYPLSGILQGDHAKLLLEHPSKPSSSLTPSDIVLYTLMFQHRLQVMEDFIRQFCSQRSPKPVCGHAVTCGKGFSRLISQLHRSWTLRTGPLYYILQAMQSTAEDFTICSVCRSDFKREASSLRQKVWDDLPTIAQLPPWDKIE
ncbi:hypothetical protein GALMADRAFT_839107 [Galerina marginata CBS 339.88]|uniref:BTB domain-containing protein n=1 Tax=Galerina marginata (strain CBS 339.88) TaxID=685588 RepID=A0A067TUK6_GALM3|nr:hypothetical protein GALMADRAFT_839107 [Galerina marginata CBS 339.88]